MVLGEISTHPGKSKARHTLALIVLITCALLMVVSSRQNDVIEGQRELIQQLSVDSEELFAIKAEFRDKARSQKRDNPNQDEPKPRPKPPRKAPKAPLCTLPFRCI